MLPDLLDGLRSGFDTLFHHLFAVSVSHGLDISRLIDGLPLEMTVQRHPLFFELAAVDDQLHLLAVAVYPNGNGLSLVPVEIPVRKYMEHRRFRPPCLQIISLILRESAIVEDTELRACRREYHRVRLTSIIKSCPVEESCKIVPLSIELPSSFDAVVQAVRAMLGTVQCDHTTVSCINGRKLAAIGHVEINSSCSTSGSLL